MFTGIVQAVGRIARREEKGGDLRLSIQARALMARVEGARLAIGESVAISGVCLTVVGATAEVLDFDVSRETLDLTTLGALPVGAGVNLEAALRAGDPLGGHLMSGHVDAIAEVVALREDARSVRLQVQVPPALARLVASKGSVALDGVSLTVNEVDGARFGVNLIPHTVESTTFRGLAVGSRLNFEADLLARYVQRALAGQTSTAGG
jgi:riboflavin synthase